MLETEIAKLRTLRSEAYRDKALRCVASLFEFYETFWFAMSGDPLVENWHLEYICNELQELGMRMVHKKSSLYDLIINVPPGQSKSTMVSQAFPVWLWLHDPTMNTITSSYAGDLSTDHSLKSKNIVKSDLFNTLFQPYFLRMFGRYLKLTKDNEKDWRNNFGGARYATSTGGTVTGKHAHLIIRDDPINPEQAESKLYRFKCNRYNDRTLSSRKKDKDKTPTITVMQRLHPEDSTGHDLSKEGKPIKHICLPAELTADVNPPELRIYYKDGLLDPYRLSRNTLKQARIDLGSYGYAGQMLQNPIVEGGNAIKAAWFREYTLSQIEEEAISEHKNLQWLFTLDGAYTERESNDPSAIMAYTLWKNCLYIRDVVAVRMEMPELLKFIPEFTHRNGYNRNVSKIYIEPMANGMSVAQMLKKETKLNVVLDKPPRDDKTARVQACVPFIESGRCYILKRAGWIDTFIEEVTEFPMSEHDDQVDVMTMAIRRAIEPERGVQTWRM